MMQALPPGVLEGFPKLEFLQVMLYNSLFLAHGIGSVDSKDLNAAAAQGTFIGSKGHSTLNRINIGFWGWAIQYGQHRGGFASSPLAVEISVMLALWIGTGR